MIVTSQVATPTSETGVYVSRVDSAERKSSVQLEVGNAVDVRSAEEAGADGPEALGEGDCSDGTHHSATKVAKESCSTELSSRTSSSSSAISLSSSASCAWIESKRRCGFSTPSSSRALLQGRKSKIKQMKAPASEANARFMRAKPQPVAVSGADSKQLRDGDLSETG